ncbi:hypothetical protein HELRODRAFT_174330 [Helobdella robusta]|uniref:Uncharacterized protein n=1 Tax=Helobdella robusta TaxID=6412 RepID=T1F809_HELRO|nr:hypothetical protein HELRODRAFT_174330 [Helobdella robusta]ESO02888.1 hypothetical protein HELRODRAFT_174330 [Helobdella robusta]
MGDVDCNAREIGKAPDNHDARVDVQKGSHHANEKKDDDNNNTDYINPDDDWEVTGKLTNKDNELKELTKSNDSEDEKVSRDKLDTLEKDLKDETTERNIPKSKGRSHQREHREIKRPKQEHTDEMKEQEDENDVRVKQFRDESRDRLNERQDEIEKPKNDSKLKDDYAEERNAQIDHLQLIKNRRHALNEWKGWEKSCQVATWIDDVVHRVRKRGKSRIKMKIVHLDRMAPTQNKKTNAAKGIDQIEDDFRSQWRAVLHT